MKKIASARCFWLVAVLAFGIASCTRDQGTDPAGANMAPTEPVDQSGPAAQSEAPIQNASYDQQLSAAPDPPPPLPVYSQPECPGENYLWTPGYWSYSSGGYYWAPGAWVMAPFPGALWTPPWWGYSGSRYVLHAGYWGPYVGFYGGINYGFGYTGQGFYGGYWQSGTFNYNRAVMNVNVSVVRNVYNRSVTNYTPANHVAYNGGQGGLSARPVASEQVALRDRRMAALPVQVQQEREAAANRAQFASANGGRPAVVAARPEPVSNARPEERAPMQTNNARPEAGPPNIRPMPSERPRTEQAPRVAAPAPEVRRIGEAQREAQPPQENKPSAFQPRQAPEARPAPRPEPVARPQVQQARPESHPEPARPQAQQPRPESRPEPPPRPQPIPPKPAPARGDDRTKH